jgi:uncharacterized protein (TIGR02145 family)
MRIILSFLLVVFSLSFRAQGKIELVKINNDWWSMTNLCVTQFRNGDEIRNAKTSDEWIECLQNGIPAYCAYKNDTTLAKKYGYMYNWFAIADPRGLAPEKTRVAHNGDFSRLHQTVNEGVVNGPNLNMVGVRLRDSLGWDIGAPGENQYDFGILPGGYRNENGDFVGLGKETALWVRDTLFDGKLTLGNAYSSTYALIHGQKPNVIYQSDGKRSGCYVRVVLGEAVIFTPKPTINENESPENESDSKKKSKKKN